MSSKVYRPGDAIKIAPAVWQAVGQPAQLGAPAVQTNESATQAAHQRGLQEGRAAAEAAAMQKASAQLAPVLKNLGSMIQELSGARQRLRMESEESMVQLALAIARRV